MTIFNQLLPIFIKHIASVLATKKCEKIFNRIEELMMTANNTPVSTDFY